MSLYKLASAQKIENHTACNDGGNLTGDIYAHSVHKQKVLLILLLSHFMNHTGGHGKGGYARGTYHGVDLSVAGQEQVDNLCKDPEYYLKKIACLLLTGAMVQ